MLIGNKCDMPNREVPYNMAMDYARSKNFGFLEVSAKTGANIKSSFSCLVRGKHIIMTHHLLIYIEIYKN